MRHLIKKGDPKLNILLPLVLKEFLLDSAKLNKRSLQDEIIKRLIASFKHGEVCAALQNMYIDIVKSVYKDNNKKKR